MPTKPKTKQAVASEIRSSFARLRRHRLLALATLQQAMKVLDREEALLSKKLLKLAPKPVARFLKNTGMMENLFEIGTSGRAVRLPKSPLGLARIEALRSGLKSLERTWRKVVKVTSGLESNRLWVNIELR